METVKSLENDFVIKSVSTEAFGELWVKHAKGIFDDTQMIFRVRENFSNVEWEKFKALNQNMGQPFRLNLTVFHEDELAGWCWGIQESGETFYMVNSAVLPLFRRKGLYTELMNAMVEAVSAKGFQIIYSRHHATNNAVLVPKLKAGFIISSFEISDAFGVLVHLRLYTNPLRRKLMTFRTGDARPDAEISKALKL